MGLVLLQFPEAFIEFGREIHQHEDLMEAINEMEDKDFPLLVAQAAAYCQIALDGIYSQDALVGICEVIIRRLKEKRTSLILPNEYGNFDIH